MQIKAKVWRTIYIFLLQAAAELGFSSPLKTGRYVGLPSLIGKFKKAIFGFLKERLWKRLQGCKHKFLSRAGKEI